MQSSANTHELPRVVIVGGGFAGMAAARHLRKVPVQVTLVDRRNHYLFQPLLYQVATGGLSPDDIADPIRLILRTQKNASVHLDEVTGVDLNQKKVQFRSEEIAYDYLVLSPGTVTSHFHHADWKRWAPGLKSLEDSLEVRRRVLLAFELAEREPDPQRRQALLTFVIVGGGPTGVELAGAIAEIGVQVLASGFRSIEPKETRVILVQSGPRILPGFPEDLSAKAEHLLTNRLGVEVRTNSRANNIRPQHVTIGDETINAGTTLWAAGVRPNPLAQTLDVELDGKGRVKVNGDLSVSGHPEVFVAGDLAAFEQDGKTLPGLAPVAIQEGRHAARNISLSCRGESREAFHYRDRGMLATIGRAAAVARVGRFHLSGRSAWIAWLFVHILYLAGFLNRVSVVTKWAWNYTTRRRAARVIISGHLDSEPAVTEAGKEQTTHTQATASK